MKASCDRFSLPARFLLIGCSALKLGMMTQAGPVAESQWPSI